MNPAMRRVYEKCGYHHEGVAGASSGATAAGTTPICTPSSSEDWFADRAEGPSEPGGS